MVLYAFFTDGICPQQFEEPPSLTDERACDTAQLYSLPQGSFFFGTDVQMDPRAE